MVDVSASYRQHAILQIAQDIKEAVCRVSDAPFDPEENANIPQASYELPDGQEISVGVDRFALCECLFNTSLLERYGAAAQGLLAAAGAEAGGDGPASLQAAINDCITRCDVDARRELYANVLLTGGTAGFASLKDRLERELTEVAPALARVKVVRWGILEGGSGVQRISIMHANHSGGLLMAPHIHSPNSFPTLPSTPHRSRRR